ncbi:DUF4129 domain-containing protein [Actinospongicola halichondriae]|uniref:DUF4129 domain-containing protein n=1 Tax=Actinospongicola halichondriae TaxID=3236844 RepID=UPI003D3D90A4
MSADPIARRRARLAVIVAVSCGIVAVGVTGVGLLLPGGSDTPTIRVVAAFAAVAAGAVLVRLDGPAAASRSLALVAMIAVIVCLVTLPVSPVSFTLDDPTSDSAPAAPDGSGTDTDVAIDPGTGVGGDSAAGPIRLPAGGDVEVVAGEVILSLPDGVRITLGQATIDGTGLGGSGEGTSLVVVDGVVRRDDGGPIGGDVALGGVTFERGDGSTVAVGDGRLYDVPPPVDAEDDDPAEPVDAVLALLLGLFALLAFAPPLVRFSERFPVSLLEEEPGPEPELEAPSPVRMEEGLADVLRSMLADPDPRTSVIGAYARLLTAMAEAGFPRRAEEGPHEHLWRSLGPLGVRRQPVHRLAELFVRARFTPLPVTEDDRQAAISALADAVADLRLQDSDVRAVAQAAGVPA